MNIVGRSDVPKEKVVAVGGIRFTEGIPGHCHPQHLTIPQATHVGVFGDSSFTMEDAVVEEQLWKNSCGTVYLTGRAGIWSWCGGKIHHCASASMWNVWGGVHGQVPPSD